jgi:hypothetical protein
MLGETIEAVLFNAAENMLLTEPSENLWTGKTVEVDINLLKELEYRYNAYFDGEMEFFDV